MSAGLSSIDRLMFWETLVESSYEKGEGDDGRKYT
jgi:hypothetical protein